MHFEAGKGSGELIAYILRCIVECDEKRVFPLYGLHEFGDGVDADDAPVHDKGNPVAEPFCFLDVVGGEHDRRAAPVEIGD